MKEYPVFIPFGSGHLAAIVAVPPGPPRGLVLLLQGLGAPRSHRYGLWTRTGRSLAERGIASVRFDYPEVGDSTGALNATMDHPPVEEGIAVAETVMEALGIDAFGAVGNCMGGTVGFTMAARHEGCVTAVSLGDPKSLLHGQGRSSPQQAKRRAARRLPKVAKMIRPYLSRRNGPPKQRVRFIPIVGEAVRSAHVLFLMLDKDIGPSMRRCVAAIGAVEGRPQGLRTEVRGVEAEGGTILQLPIEAQQKVIDEIVDWMDETLPAASTPAESVTATADASGASPNASAV